MNNVIPHTKYLRRLLTLALWTTALLSPFTLSAQSDGSSLCSTPPYQAKPLTDKNSDDQQIQIQADNVRLTEKNISLFNGNVDISRQQQQIHADQVEYHKDKNYLRAEGHVDLYTPLLKISGTKAEFNINNNQGTFHNAKYATTQRGRGAAALIDIQSDNTVLLTDTLYTTCDPEKTDWQMNANKIKLDNDKHQGYAENVVLEFKGVPFFYLPYLRFPLGEDRLSGFLFPSFGTSEQHGSELLLPYYWNIAPDLDATITPWIMSKRGTLLQNELRYLNTKSSGQLELDNLNDDKIFNDDRTRARWQHKGASTTGWSSFVDVNYVADNQHFIDFSDNLENSSTTHLNRKGSIAYNAEDWFFDANMQSYQTLSGASPYQQLPQLTLASRELAKNKQFNFDVKSELVQFGHSDDAVVIGNRLDLSTILSYPIRSAASYIIPKLQLRHTQYKLEQTLPGQEQNPSRNLPIFSIDSGLIFERDSQFFSHAYTQTLEPQLHYLYVPYRDQSALPVFNTSLYDFNINNTFFEDRFIGADRVGDANQLTAALATRFYRNDTGADVFSARIGQIFYYADREVTLPAGNIETRAKSNIIAEIIARPTTYWYLGSDMEWDIDQDKIASGNARLSFTPGTDLQIQSTYRFERDTLKTAELGFRWQLNPRWQLTARRIDDLLADRSQQEQIALRYNSCCWGLTLQLENRYLSDLLQYDKGVYLQLELKGLSNIGRRRTISGFE